MIWIDTETGGTDPERDPLIQLAAIVVRNSETIDSLEMKVKVDPARVGEDARAVNGYDPAIWETEAITEAEVVRRFSAFIEPYRVVPMVSKKGSTYYLARLAGHNVQFDCGFIQALYLRQKQPGEQYGPFLAADVFRPLDTLQLALWWFVAHPKAPLPKNYKLSTLCEYFEVDLSGQLHDALVDVRAAAALARVLLTSHPVGVAALFLFPGNSYLEETT